MVRKDFENVPIPKEVLRKIDVFVQTPAAKRLVVRSRPELLVKAAIAVLEKHDRMYEELQKLFNISDEEIKELEKRESVRKWQLDKL